MTDGLENVYGGSLALLTDLYQLTMACGYWKSGVADREAVFHLTFRRAPFGGGYAIAAGLGPALEFLERFRFTADDLAYLATLRDRTHAPLFPQAFLDYLGEMRWSCNVDAMPEGSLAFPHEPLVRVRGPIAQAQLVETPLLALINYQTLVATKAARVTQAARGAPVLEFGLRRAQGIDGGLAGARASYIGGTHATSNVRAGKLFGIPVSGTHAHSWVMFHDSEIAAFRAYAAAMPGNCTFLVDTYDTIAGIAHAITVGNELRAHGHELAGIRLDSGDLAHLSVEGRRMLDAAGFPDAKIVASNDLDEQLIGSIIDQGARIDTWGVGTKLITAYDQPALGGVYKLGASRDEHGVWRDAIKLSEQPIKISNPGILQVRRLRRGDEFVGDVIYDSERGLALPIALHDLEDPSRAAYAPAAETGEDLLIPVMTNGQRVGPRATLEQARARAAADLARLSPRTRRFLNPQPYPVGLDRFVHTRKQELISRARRPGIEDKT
ncbi:MAG TPA: nicotinate phosphoribosyltransferase [Kofleriaceae bacterium]|nr:nicotinate phosphoribosyltransferase [Kofleriaceae bacterium]